MNLNTDQRLKPRPRKHAKLWQMYLTYVELEQLRTRHVLRKLAAERGVSNLDVEWEQDFIDKFRLDAHVHPKNKKDRRFSIFDELDMAGREVGPIYDWLSAHKGVGPKLSAKVLALIDDIARFDSVAKLWRFAGYGLNYYWHTPNGKVICPQSGWKWIEVKKGKKYRVWTIVQNTNVTHTTNDIPIEKQWAVPQSNKLEKIERVDYLVAEPDWKLKNIADRLCKKYHAPYCTPLKAAVHLISASFKMSSNAPYSDIYYKERKRYDNLYPNRTKKHLDLMSMRKIKKEFLKRLWLTWREMEGLPLSEPFE